MNSSVTNEHCEQIDQSVLEELGFTNRTNLVGGFDMVWLNRGYLLDVTTMNLSSGLVQSKCGMMLNGRYHRC